MEQKSLFEATKDKDMICSECSCSMKTKFMIRVDYSGEFDDCRKGHFEATTRRSIVGWLKLICNEFGHFHDITIHNLTKQCHIHKEFHKEK